MIPHATDSAPDPRWLCVAVTDGTRCSSPATAGGLCPFHQDRP